MRKPTPVLAVQLSLMFLILFTAYPNAAAASSTSEPPLAGVSGGGLASSMMNPAWHCDWWNMTLCYPYYSGYYWPYYPYYNWWYYYPSYYYYPRTTTTTAKSYELTVQTNPPGVATVNGGGKYSQGTVASFGLTSLIVPVSTTERYVFSYWTGDYSGSSPSGTITMDAAKTVTAYYQIEYYLKVSIDPAGVAAAAGDGWYRPGDSVSIGPVPVSVPGGEGRRYVFQQWTVDDAQVSGNAIQVMMDAPHTVVARYRTQYMLTVSSDYGSPQGAGWYDAGSSATFWVTTPVETSYGVSQVFQRWTGDTESRSPTATITMDSAGTVRAVWRTDNTILYATIALAVGAAFAVGIGLTLFAITRFHRLARAPPPPRPTAAVEPVPEKLKPPPTKKRVKPPPKTDKPEPSAEA